MTERQGGSDVRANQTTARPDGAVWLLDGVYGTLPAGLDLAAIAERHRPRLAS